MGRDAAGLRSLLCACVALLAAQPAAAIANGWLAAGPSSGWRSEQTEIAGARLFRAASSIGVGLGHDVGLAINLPEGGCEYFSLTLAAQGAFIPGREALMVRPVQLRLEVDGQVVGRTTLRLDDLPSEPLSVTSGLFGDAEQELLRRLQDGQVLTANIRWGGKSHSVRFPLQGFRGAMESSRVQCASRTTGKAARM